MSFGLNYLHSHSDLERTLHFPKRFVIVDEKFAKLFLADTIKHFRHNGVNYIQVPILSFVKCGGVFKNLSI